VDAVGIEVPGHPVVDFFALTFDQIVQLSYVDPARFAITSPLSAAENRKILQVYASAMEDPTLRGRLTGIDVPTLVVWGSADGIAGPGYGRAFAEAIPGARFVELDGVGHLPQIEAPDRLLKLVSEFAGA